MTTSIPIADESTSSAGASSLPPADLTSPPTEGPSLLPSTRTRIPALDGLRAVAVAMVVVYHVAPELMPAGFLGVSLFFTLSGFLITRLLLGERLTTGRLALRRFWGRRYRRLTPAALLTLGAITVVWAVTGWMTGAIAGDIVASLAQVANWRFLSTGTAYGATTDASPVLHFWSLAIEEQFYLLYPLIAWLALRRTTRPLRSLGILLGVLLAASLAYTLSNSSAPLTVYFSTFSRAGEVLIGALVAVLTWRLTRPTRSWILGGAGAVAVLGLVVLAVTTRLTDPLWAYGGLTAVGLVSSLAVVGATQPGLFGRAMSLGALVRVGELSYGIYLFHWPILVALRTTDLAPGVVAAITISSSGALALLSLRLLENPVRHQRWRRVRPLALALPLTLVIGGAAIWTGARSTVPVVDFTGGPGIDDLEAFTATSSTTAPGAAVDPSTDLNAAPLVVSVFGDSTAWQLRDALVGADPRIEVRPGWSDLGCTLTRGGPLKGAYTTDQGYPQETERCDWTERWPAVARSVGTEQAIVYGGVWDTAPRQNPALWDGWKTIEDPVVVDHVRSEMVALTDALHAAGARTVVWLTLAPNLDVDSELNRRRVGIFNQILSEAAEQRPGVLRVIDIAGWFATQPESLRPDGVHVTEETGRVVVSSWLGDQLLLAADRDPTAPVRSTTGSAATATPSGPS